jgi:hypothetical protein
MSANGTNRTGRKRAGAILATCVADPPKLAAQTSINLNDDDEVLIFTISGAPSKKDNQISF